MTGCCPVQGESLVDRRRPTADALLCSTLEFELCLGRPSFVHCRIGLCLLLNRRRHQVGRDDHLVLGLCYPTRDLEHSRFPTGFPGDVQRRGLALV